MNKKNKKLEHYMDKSKGGLALFSFKDDGEAGAPNDACYRLGFSERFNRL